MNRKRTVKQWLLMQLVSLAIFDIWLSLDLKKNWIFNCTVEKVDKRKVEEAVTLYEKSAISYELYDEN